MAATPDGLLSTVRVRLVLHSIEHGVPKSTLKDRTFGRVKHGSRFRPPFYLPEDEEEVLVAKKK